MNSATGTIRGEITMRVNFSRMVRISQLRVISKYLTVIAKQQSA